MKNIQKHCAEKSYSIPDQTAAGCHGNETLDQCMEKLVHHCLENYRPFLSGGSLVPRTIKDARIAAKEAAVRAKALSEKLADYARQAEQHVKAWK
ncbi:MAG: hypothetical protein ABW166_15445 [Sedimenticola sp.]